MLKRLILLITAYILNFSFVYADVDISKYTLGMSSKTLHNQLVADGFYFSYSIHLGRIIYTNKIMNF